MDIVVGAPIGSKRLPDVDIYIYIFIYTQFIEGQSF